MSLVTDARGEHVIFPHISVLYSALRFGFHRSSLGEWVYNIHAPPPHAVLALGAEVSFHSISTFNMGEPAITPTIAVSPPPVVVARIRSFLLLQQILNEVGQLDILIFFSQSNKAE